MTDPDPLADFTRFPFRALGKERPVFRKGEGPAVLVMHEAPGIIPQVAHFARRVAGAGFTVFMPNLFGTPGKPLSMAYALETFARACISREFHCLAENRSSPITDWLRALARHAFEEIGGKGVGAVGMCLTGNFALTLALDPWVLAPVLAQPSLPFPLTDAKKRAVHATPETLRHVGQRAATEGFKVLGLRFAGDRICPAQRFDTLQEKLGGAFERIEIPDAAANPAAPGPPHGVLTTHLMDKPGEPTHAALERVIALFTEALK